jgi:hypothetical protein
MVKHYWQGVHKGVALCRSGKKAPETEQRKTSVVAGGAASDVATGDAGEGGAFPGGSTNASLEKRKTRASDTRRWNDMEKEGQTGRVV